MPGNCWEKCVPVLPKRTLDQICLKKRTEQAGSPIFEATFSGPFRFKEKPPLVLMVALENSRWQCDSQRPLYFQLRGLKFFANVCSQFNISFSSQCCEGHCLKPIRLRSRISSFPFICVIATRELKQYHISPSPSTAALTIRTQ